MPQPPQKDQCPKCDGQKSATALRCRKCYEASQLLPGTPDAPPLAVGEVQALRKQAGTLQQPGEDWHKARLMKAALAEPDKGGVQQDTEWVYQNLNVPYNKIPSESVPSPGALGLLEQAKLDKRWFLQTYHAKLLPLKSKYESDGWFESDEDDIENMVSEVKEELARAQ